VLCIETEKANRPEGYAAMITSFLAEKGYVNATSEQGRNTCKLITYLFYISYTSFEDVLCLSKTNSTRFT
jgi:hypothetical protein